MAPCRPSDAWKIEDITVEWQALRQSFVNHYGNVLKSEQVVASSSVEEISILASILVVQKELLDNGVASGSLVISQTGPLKTTAPAFDQFDPFELQFFERLYDAYLKSTRLKRSYQDLVLTTNFMFEEQAQAKLLDMLCTTTSSKRQEIVDMQDLEQLLVQKLSATRASVIVLLEHWLASRRVLSATSSPQEVLIRPIFDFRRVVKVVDACLCDSSLGVAECGLLLLRSCFLDHQTLDDMYQLAFSVIRWTLDEQRSLTEAARTHESAASVLATRQRLVRGYIQPWLSLLRDTDPDDYQFEVFEIILNLGRDRMEGTEHDGPWLAETLLQSMEALKALTLDFGAFQLWYRRWLDEICILHARSQNVSFSAVVGFSQLKRRLERCFPVAFQIVCFTRTAKCMADNRRQHRHVT